MGDEGRLDRRGRAGAAALWAVVVADAFAVVAGVAYAAYLSTLAPDAVIEDLELVGAELAYFLAGVAQLLTLVVAAIFFIRWFHLAHLNLARLDGEEPVYRSSWAIWGFFVPFLNLIRPQQVMREVWERSRARWQEDPSRVLGLTPPPDSVNLWWGLFLATNFLGNATGRASFGATTANETLWAAGATILVDALDIVAAVVAVMLVRRVTALQRPLLRGSRPLPIA